MPSLVSVTSKGKKYWRIVESRRINGKPRPVPICYLGTVENILEKYLHGNSSDEKGIVSIQSFSHGSIAALMAVAKELNLVSIIDKHTEFSSVGQTLLLAALNRAICPRSKRGWIEWAKKTSISRFFPDLDLDQMTSQYFWSEMHKVPEKALESIEEELTKKVVDLYGIGLETLFYDTTNFFTYIDSENHRCNLPQRGRNKQKRADLRQFSLAVLVSKDGRIPLCTHTYEGNKVDVTQFPDSLTQIRKRLQGIIGELNKVTIVYDKGNNSIYNQGKVDESEIGYIASLSLNHHSELRNISANEYGSILEGKLKDTKIYRLTQEIWGQERTVVLFISDKLREGQIRGFRKNISKALEKLQKWKERLDEPKTGPKTKENAKKQINAILSGQYCKDVLKVVYDESKSKKDRLTWELDIKKQESFEKELFGKRILITNRHDWSTEDIISGYHGQGHIERVFKQCKDDEHFAIRPQFHWTDQKIRVHVFICLLALMLGQILERKAHQYGKKESLSEIMESLSSIRLALILENTLGKSKSQQITWTLEDGPRDLRDFFLSLVPNKAPFVYTKNSTKKRAQKLSKDGN